MTARRTSHFSGRSAIVTGGGSGIGAALTRALVAAGADVVSADIAKDAAADVARNAVGPGKARPLGLDVTDAASVQQAVDGVVERAGALDLLINNAGIFLGGETHLLTLQQWNQIIDVNMRGVVHGVNAAYPHMITAGRGHMVNIASTAGLVPSGLMTSYVMTKHAVVGMSLALRAEAVAHGVGVTVICPGVTETPILDTGSVGSFNGRQFHMRGRLSGKASSAETLAEDVLSAVALNKAMIVTTAEARAGWILQRLAPGLMQRQNIRFVTEQRKG